MPAAVVVPPEVRQGTTSSGREARTSGTAREAVPVRTPLPASLDSCAIYAFYSDTDSGAPTGTNAFKDPGSAI